MRTLPSPRRVDWSFGTVLTHLVVWVLCVLVLLPIGYIIVASFKTNVEINRVLSWPSSLYLDNYAHVFQNPLFISGTLNSLVITVAALALSISVAALAGYAIGRRKEKVFVVIYLVFLASLMIPTGANLTALYTLMKNLGLLNTRVGLVLLYATGLVPFGVLLYAGFVKTIPVELDEAATIDGCGYFSRFVRVILPLLKPAIVTQIVLGSIGTWNDFFLPFLFITSDANKTLPLVVYTFQGDHATDYGGIIALMVLSLIPPIVVFLLTQRYFYNSIAGAVRG